MTSKKEWQAQIRKTKWASKKKRLSKKELNDIQKGMMMMERLRK